MTMDNVARVRGLGFVAGVLDRQQHEPLCGRCKGFVNTLEKARKHLAEATAPGAQSELPAEWRDVLEAAAKIISAIPAPTEPVPQRKLGNCRLKDGKCLVKKVRRFVLPDEEDSGEKEHKK